MRLITFVPPDGMARAGALLGNTVVDLAAAAPLVVADPVGLRWDMLSLLQGYQEDCNLDTAAEIVAAVTGLVDGALAVGPDEPGPLVNGDHDQGMAGTLSLGGAEMLLPLEQVRLRAPLPRPASLRLFEVPEWNITPNYDPAQPLKLPPAWYPFPAFAFGNHGAIYGPDADILLPQSDMLHYELEVACVIGHAGRDIAPDEAADYIAGYMLANDWVAYDILASERAWGVNATRARDFATSLGPWLATPDELELYMEDDGRLSLALVARVNAAEHTRDNFSRSFYPFPELVAHASRGVMLYPGDVLCSGGIIGHGLPLQRGDVVELEATGLGSLRNRLT